MSCFHKVNSHVTSDGTLLLDDNESQHARRFIKCYMCWQALVMLFTC